MKNISEIIDYRDTNTVNKVFETVKQKREAKKIAEEKAEQERLASMATHEELIKEDEDVKHDKKSDKDFWGPYIIGGILRACQQQQCACAVQAPGCAVDAVFVAVQRHQCVVGQRADHRVLQVAGKREQRTLVDIQTQNDIPAVQGEVDVLAHDVAAHAGQQVVKALAHAAVNNGFIT